jgi:hypothetical protein
MAFHEEIQEKRLGHREEAAKLPQMDLRVNELHFALFVILFSAMFKFGG